MHCPLWIDCLQLVEFVTEQSVIERPIAQLQILHTITCSHRFVSCIAAALYAITYLIAFALRQSHVSMQALLTKDMSRHTCQLLVRSVQHPFSMHVGGEINLA